MVTAERDLRTSRDTNSASVGQDSGQRHGHLEDLLGLATGAFLAALGMSILHGANVVTGGTAGVSLLASYVLPLGLPILFVLINLPFFVLAVSRKGWGFTLRSLAMVAAVSGLTAINGHLLDFGAIPPGYGVVAGNLLAGVGLLILFRHGASLGGFGIVALIVQERLGWRAGYVLLVLDGLVLLAAVTIVSLPVAAVSALGAVVLNVVIATNHRPGRYRGEVSRLAPW